MPRQREDPLAEPLLEVRDLVVRYGFLEAVSNLGINLAPGGMAALIGANGAGKTTTLRAIAGLNKPAHGTIWFQGQRIDRLPANQVVERGISLVPEARQIFGKLTVMENLQMGAYVRRGRKVFSQTLERVFSHFPRLKERIDQKAGTMSGGEQQMLAISRSLMSQASLIMMDEPSLGLAPLMVEEIGRAIKQLNEEGVSILLVEQNARMALSVVQKGYVLQQGRLVVEGTAEELTENELVREAYLGV